MKGDIAVRSFSIFIVLLGILLAACATLPPAKPVQDLKSIAGKWEGTATSGLGTFPYRTVIKEDGSWEGVAPDIPPGKFQGSMVVKDGKIRSLSRTTGRAYTFTLHEGEGTRVLRGVSDEKDVTIVLRPAK